MDMKRAPKRRSFWQYNKKNWPGMVALLFILGIGYPAARDHVWEVILLMAAALVVLIIKSISDWKVNG